MNAIRPPSGFGIGRIGGKTGIIRLATSNHGNAGELPTAQYQISHSTCVIQKVSALPERQFVQIADNKAVAKVRLHGALFRTDGINTLEITSHVAVGTAQILGKRVRGQQVETVREAFVN